MQLMACILAALVSTLGGWCVVLYANHSSLQFWCGLLPTVNDEFLDGSGKTFQKGGWHLGDGSHIWGEACGLKVSRIYLTMGIKHVNPKRTAEEAKE